jgi:hypothetical protein
LILRLDEEGIYGAQLGLVIFPVFGSSFQTTTTEKSVTTTARLYKLQCALLFPYTVNQSLSFQDIEKVGTTPTIRSSATFKMQEMAIQIDVARCLFPILYAML